MKMAPMRREERLDERHILAGDRRHWQLGRPIRMAQGVPDANELDAGVTCDERVGGQARPERHHTSHEDGRVQPQRQGGAAFGAHGVWWL